MYKIIIALLFLVSGPSFALAAPLTNGQALSLIGVVQSSPGTPASAFTELITAFSNITVAQANSLIGVVQAAPGVAPDAFIGLLLAFTQDQVATTQTPTVPDDIIVPMETAPKASAPQAINTPASPAVPAQTAPAFVPFVRTGSASVSLVAKTTMLPLSGDRVYLATLSIVNGTNETLILSDLGVSENSFFTVANNSIAGWQPQLVGIYRNIEFRQDQRGIKPGETVEVRFVLNDFPPVSGSFGLSMTKFRLLGQDTGSFIELSGFPLDLGTFTVE